MKKCKWYCEKFLIDHWHVKLNWVCDSPRLICGQDKFGQSKITQDYDEMTFCAFFLICQCFSWTSRVWIAKTENVVYPALERNCCVHNFFIKSLLKIGSWKDNGQSHNVAVMCKIRTVRKQKVDNKILFQSLPHNGVIQRHFKSILLLISARPLNPSIWDNVSVSE